MITAIFNLDDKKESILMVVIEKSNHDRMKHGDPITLHSTVVGGCLEQFRYSNVSVIIGYEEDAGMLRKMLLEENGLAKLLEHLYRGYRFDPDKDGPQNSTTVKQ